MPKRKKERKYNTLWRSLKVHFQTRLKSYKHLFNIILIIGYMDTRCVAALFIPDTPYPSA